MAYEDEHGDWLAWHCAARATLGQGWGRSRSPPSASHWRAGKKKGRVFHTRPLRDMNMTNSWRRRHIHVDD